MRYDLIVRGGSVVTAEGVAPRAIAVADGVIAAIAEEVEGSAAEEVDATGLVVMPGAVDAPAWVCGPRGLAESVDALRMQRTIPPLVMPVG